MTDLCNNVLFLKFADQGLAMSEASLVYLVIATFACNTLHSLRQIHLMNVYVLSIFAMSYAAKMHCSCERYFQ